MLRNAPSAVFEPGAGEAAGTNAWGALRSRPMVTSTRHLGLLLAERDVSGRARALVAGELAGCIAEHPLAEGERVWIAAPARAQAHGLAALLGIARDLSLPVDGFIDCAAVTVAALGLERNTIVLELGLHHAAATAVDADAGRARRRRTVLAERGGLIELYQAWLDFIGTTMVKRTRFDPLHDAATEQRLFDDLPALAREAAAGGTTTVVVAKGAEHTEVTLTRDQFALAAQRVYREVAGLLHELRPAGAPVTIVMPRAVADLPGLRETVEQFAGCELVLVPDGFAGAATSLLDLPERPPEEDSVRLLRRLPLSAPPEQAIPRESLGTQRSAGSVPSHAMFDGRAYSLGEAPLVVGRAPGTPRSIALPDGLAGVSRRHCTLGHDCGELVLLDHSTFGTFVNGERVAERVRVHAGDKVRLGEPGVELALIAVGEVPVTRS